MFKKFEEKESISSVQQLKSSVQKGCSKQFKEFRIYYLTSSCLSGIRNSILDTYPDIGDYLDSFLPKKDQFKVVKCHDHVELLINSGGDLLFWRWVVKTVVMTDDDGDDDGDD